MVGQWPTVIPSTAMSDIRNMKALLCSGYLRSFSGAKGTTATGLRAGRLYTNISALNVIHIRLGQPVVGNIMSINAFPMHA